jgi:hypothetical protein
MNATKVNDADMATKGDEDFEVRIYPGPSLLTLTYSCSC